MNNAVVTSGLRKRYGRTNALDGFSLAVPRGSITGLVGRNGAGKTTWMMTVAGLTLPDSGTINILGRGPFDAERHSGRVGVIPQDSELPAEAKVRDLLIDYGLLQSLPRDAAARSADALIGSFNLSDKAQAKIRTLSHGMRKRVMIAQAFLGNVELVLLDEPLSGLDPVEADNMRSFLASMQGKMTIVISSHQLDDIERLCSHVAFVSDGKVERMDTLRSITSQSGRIAYRLARVPADIAELSRVIAGVVFSVEGDSVAAEFSGGREIPEINAEILPRLLPYGVLSVTPGRSLEAAYLNRV
jgi:ABC-type multidrug transport system ATPase subunit